MPVRSSLKRLSQTFVDKHATPGLYSDGNGLYLQITAGTASRDDEDQYVPFCLGDGAA